MANTINKINTATQAALDAKQPLDADLTTIAGLTPTTDNFIQSKAGAWASRTIAQVISDLQAAAWTFAQNIIANGTNNTMPNHVGVSPSNAGTVMVRDQCDTRYPTLPTISASGISSIALYDPMFSSGAASTTAPGSLGWEGSGLTYQTPATGEIAYWRATTGSSTNDKARCLLRGSISLNVGSFYTSARGTFSFRFRLNQLTACQFIVGVIQPPAAGAGSIVDKAGAYLRFDSATDTNFMLQNGATAASAVSSGVAADTSWHVVRIRIASGTSVFYSIDGAAEVQSTVSIETASVAPGWVLMTTTTAAKTCDISAFSGKIETI